MQSKTARPRDQGIPTQTLNRRAFVKQSVSAVSALTVLSGSRVLGANERIVVGVMGVGGRGTVLVEKFAAWQDVAIAYLCDFDMRRFKVAWESVEKVQGCAPKVVQDFRRILEDR